MGLELKFDVIALSETWLKDNDNTMFEMEGYNNCTESIPDRREPYRRVPLGRVRLDERRLDEVQ